MQVTAVLIEDSIAMRRAVIPAMKELTGIDVVAFAEDVHGARHLMAIEHFHLVVLDLFLSVGTGLDVLADLRTQSQDKPVFILTNHATHDVRQACLQAGATAVFDKSSELDAFFERCSHIANAQRAHNAQSSMGRQPAALPLPQSRSLSPE